MHPKTPFSVDLEETVQQLRQLNRVEGIRNDGGFRRAERSRQGYLLPGGIGEGQRTAGVGKRSEIQMEISVRQGEEQTAAARRARQGEGVFVMEVDAVANQPIERGADVGGEDIESARLCNNIKPIRGRGDRKRITIVIYLDTDIIRCGFKGKNVGIQGKNVGILIVKPQTEIAASLNDGQAEAVINTKLFAEP